MIHVEILQGLTRDQLTSELSRLKRLVATHRAELRDYAETVERLRSINDQLDRENKALREISEGVAPGVVTSGGVESRPPAV